MPAYFVSTTGDDSNSGDILSPFATIQHAADLLTPGDAIIIRGGTYNEYVHFDNGGLLGAIVTVAGTEGETVIIDGTGAPPPDSSTGQFWVNASFITIQNLEIANSTTFGIYISSGKHQNISNVRIHDSLGTTGPSGIMIEQSGSGPSMGVIDGCQVYDCPGGGISIWTSPGGYWLIQNNIVHDLGGNGNWDMIQVGGQAGASHHVIVRGNTIYNSDPAADAIDMGGHAPVESYIMEHNYVYGPDNTKRAKFSLGETGANCIQRFNILDKANAEIYINPPVGLKSYNNTFYQGWHFHQFVNDGAPSVAHFQSDVQGLTYKNNLYLEPASYPFNCWPPADCPINYDSIDVNGNAHKSGTTSLDWDGNSYSNDLDGFSSWRATENVNLDGYFLSSLPVAGNGVYLPQSFPVVTGGIALTHVASGSGTSMIVDESRYFSDGYGLRAGDILSVGGKVGQIAGIDYGTHEITLLDAVSFNAGDPVNIWFSGKGPFIGALAEDTGGGGG